jgi:hypothetical protein
MPWRRKVKRCPSDLTEAEWAILEPLVLQAKPGGGVRTRAMIWLRAASVSRGLRPAPGRSPRPANPWRLNRVICLRTVWG